MVSRKIMKLVELIILTCAFVFISNSFVLASIEFDAEALEAEIVAAVAEGADPVQAARRVVDKAIQEIVAANPNYPGGQEALYAAILEAIANLHITGLDDTDLFVSGLEAYEPPERQNYREARLGPGGKPTPSTGI